MFIFLLKIENFMFLFASEMIKILEGGFSKVYTSIYEAIF